jgi:hypothetical protein
MMKLFLSWYEKWEGGRLVPTREIMVYFRQI